jgi:PAS domain S-box-containing protein
MRGKLGDRRPIEANPMQCLDVSTGPAAPEFRRVFESAPDLYLVLLPNAPNFTIAGASDAYLRATGTRRGEIVGRGIFDVFPDNPDDPQASGVRNLSASLGRALTGRAPDAMAVQRYDVRRTDAEGGGFEQRWWSPLNSPVLAEDGSVAYLLHRVEDVTEVIRLRHTDLEQQKRSAELRSRAEQLEADVMRRAEQLQQANEQLREANAEISTLYERSQELFSLAADGIWITDLEGRFTDLNRAAGQLLGCAREELIGTPIADLLAPENADRLGRLLERADVGDASFEEWSLRHRDGRFVPLEVNMKLLPGGRWLAFVRDLTERNQLQEALTRARDVAVSANEVKSRFLAAASHDLRQPLQTIWGVQAALQRAWQNSEFAPQLQLLEDAVRSMDHMLSSLIDINRLEKGAILPVKRDFSMEEILPRLRSEFSYMANAKSLILNIDQSREIARSDPMLLPVILRNLIGNAVKYTQRGTVSLRVRREDSDLCIDVIDSGPGIPAEHLQRIFDAFYQIDNPSGDHRHGVGLGLSIVQTICRLLEHTVAIESEPGRGSIFTVRLPRGHAENVAPEAAAGKQPPAARPTRSAKVLLIDDDLGVSRAMEMLLKMEGYEVACAATREEALERVQVDGLRPDLILCDFHFPMGVTGDQIVADLARVLGAKPPTIILTGDIADSHVQQAKQIADRLLPKPIDVDLLLRDISALLS